MINISKFSLRVVKEEGGRYDLNSRAIKNPRDAYLAFNKVLEMDKRTQEVFAMLTLDIKNQITGIFEVSVGGLTSSIVHPREVFQRAILHMASAIILCHNHPSGITSPSKDDIRITERLIDAGKIMGIDVLDHVIIGDNCFKSLKDSGDI